MKGMWYVVTAYIIDAGAYKGGVYRYKNRKDREQVNACGHNRRSGG